MLGGMSWESTKLYYSYLNEMVMEKLGGSNSAEIILSSINFQEIETLSFKGDWESIGNLMQREAKLLEGAGAEFIILCTNTIHLVKDSIVEAVEIPFIHIADATGMEIKKAGMKKVGLLGTRFTMENDFYSRILEEKYDLETLIPEKAEREKLQEIIYGQLVKGVFLESSIEECRQIISNLRKKGVDGIILGCTELPLLLNDAGLELPTFDTTRIHARQAVDFSLAQDTD